MDDPSIGADALSPIWEFNTGGDAAHDDLGERFFAKFGVNLRAGYGLTEIPMTVAMGPVSGGLRPFPHVRVTLVDEDDEVVGPGVPGEICVGPTDAGPLAGVYTPMQGYWRQPELTARSLRGGRFHTGDVGVMDDSGEFRVVGRMTDLIIRGGANVFPQEIENLLLSDQRVAAMAWAPRPSTPTWSPCILESTR